ncbi:MAG: ribonuclease D, partial [Microbacterium sp.]|nr:ribonuclease D [Microbacterium sp.]
MADVAPGPMHAGPEAAAPTGTEPSEPQLRSPEYTPVPVTDTLEGLREAIEALAAGHGPVAVDTERASGFRYSQRAYLIQMHRSGSGTFLFDPPALVGAAPDAFAPIQSIIAAEEWVLHAASQDLASLREVGLDPRRIFDTELGARLLGVPRVGLGVVVADMLGVRLEKEHSAVDWSTRPLPKAWLEYAALDVEVLVELRDLLAAELVETGKADWARQEFDFLRTFELT